MTTAYVNCAAGVAGDMLLGALVDAGADREAVAEALGGLGVGGYALSFERVQRGGIAATWANVVTQTARARLAPHRPVRAVLELLAAAELDDAVRERARRVFIALAEAEGAVHGIDPADVELHEVGAVDAIVDVVGVAAALQSLGVERIVASPIAVGHGSVSAAHGLLPNPPPAVARLLALAPGARGRRGDGDGALDADGRGVARRVGGTIRRDAAMSVPAVGYGAGSADTAGRPNVVQVLVGTETESATAPRPGRSAVELAANVDDVTGEVSAHTIAALWPPARTMRGPHRS